MGCYGYICRECGTSIRGNCFNGGENCVLIHLRHGEIVGQVEGHYNEYGGVIESDIFDKENDSINGHSAIVESTFDFEDSYYNLKDKRLVNGVERDIFHYIKYQLLKDLENVDYDYSKLKYFKHLDKYFNDAETLWGEVGTHARYVYENNIKDAYEEYKKLPNKKCVQGDMLRDHIFSLFYDIIFELYGLLKNDKDFYFKRKFETYPPCERKGYSGVVAYHKVCYNKAKKEGRLKLIPSEDDPDQSWGVIRKKYS